jgi:hypothetical protein
LTPAVLRLHDDFLSLKNYVKMYRQKVKSKNTAAYDVTYIEESTGSCDARSRVAGAGDVPAGGAHQEDQGWPPGKHVPTAQVRHRQRPL